MEIMRIGVIADTHIPTQSPVLSARIGTVFKGLDIILHVGDICELYVLEEFQETYTLTFAVFGEDDSDAVQHYLDETRVVRFGDRRVGMIHGHQFEEQQKSALGRMRRLFGRQPEPGALPLFLIEQFAGEEIQAVVFGHTHEPYMKMHNGVLVFNPGAAVPTPGHRPSVGILDVTAQSITGKVIQL
jgi:putative phosphoesterase